MSELMLNVTDLDRTISGTLHARMVDRLVAALAAEPETIEELEIASARFINPDGSASLFGGFRSGASEEPGDAGIVLINLAARVICAESTSSAPELEGQVAYHDDRGDIDAVIPYRLPDDWVIVGSMHEYRAVAPRRREARDLLPPLDVREIVYREAVPFIVDRCLAARAAGAAHPVAEIHASWLMTPRQDLRGASPREAMLQDEHRLALDLQWRELQWSFLDECPRGLPTNSRAYRFAGFCTHELALYYDLMRWLLENCWQRVCEDPAMTNASEVARLNGIRDEWLGKPQDDIRGMSPAYVIDLERKRIPMAMFPSPEALAAEDYDDEIYDAAAGLPGPVFWHLDGCNMDDEFAFSFYRTKEEWDAERRRHEEFNRKWEEDRKNGIPLPDFDDGDPFIN